MINAYNKDYLANAMENLAEAMDYSVNCQNIPLNQFMTLFINSRIADFFQEGNPKFLNLPGIEIVLEVLYRSGIKIHTNKTYAEYDKTSSYWTGWILAYYQWKSGRTFEYIQRFLPAEEICRMYNPLHEAPEQKFTEIADKIIAERDTRSKLQIIRKLSGFTQKELSEKSGVNIRTIQQYENKSKDIAKASGKNLLSLAKTLDCTIEELIQG